MLILLAACSGGDVYVNTKPGDTGRYEADLDVDTDADTDTDTGCGSGDDADRDGWTTADGDCDDCSVWVNPERDEDPTDGKDDDCDGRTDEEWSGVTVVYANQDGGGDLVSLDTLGNLRATLPLSGVEYPVWLDHGLDGGWVAVDAWTWLVTIDEDGVGTTLADFSDDPDLPVCYGVAAHPDGYYVTSQLGRLTRVDPDGTLTSLAEWNWDWNDTATFELAVYTVAVDLVTGEVGLFDYFGGFGTWSEADGLVIYRTGDPEGSVTTYSGAAKDGGGWFTAAVDANTGSYGIYRFNEDDGEWVLRSAWADEQWTPNVLSIDGDDGDFYVTANAGWYYTVWRVRDEDDQAADFYITDGTESYRAFEGIVADY